MSEKNCSSMKDEALVDCYKKWLLQEVSNDE